MSEYVIVFSRAAQKELNSIHIDINSRIFAKVNALAGEPCPPGCLKLQGTQNAWRIRIGDYRVIYSIDDDNLTIDVIAVRHRREAYE